MLPENPLPTITGEVDLPQLGAPRLSQACAIMPRGLLSLLLSLLWKVGARRVLQGGGTARRHLLAASPADARHAPTQPRTVDPPARPRECPGPRLPVLDVVAAR